MKPKLGLLLLAAVSLSGCTVISYDRVFPKLAWAWTYQAQEQRRQNREREDGERFAHELEKKLGTNWVNQLPR